MKRFILLLSFIWIAFLSEAKKIDYVLVEAESFTERGGWVLDQQFMDQMGSPFLLAHGMGIPVKDATTQVKVPKGKWNVYARTWNWCSPWQVKESPGKFKVAFGGQELENELGNGKEWDWELAGAVDVKIEDNVLSLKDLTGFEGRCDAILFVREGVALPESKTLPAFRKKCLGLPEKPVDAGEFDFVVVGGGVAGIAAAVKAAREGIKVALINDRPVLGGNNSTEVRIVASGALCAEPYPVLGTVTKEIRNVYDKSDKVLEMVKAEKTLSYFPNMHVSSATMDGEKITSVLAKHIETGEEFVFRAPYFADCTGDGNLGFLAGADFRVGREKRSDTRETLAPDYPDNFVLGATISWRTKVMPEPVPFPRCPWAIQFTEKSCEPETSGSNWWESGFLYDQVGEAEYIRDYLFRAIFGNWAFLKNDSKNKKDYDNRAFSSMTYVMGKRESRRLVGDVFFVQQDIEGRYTRYDDALVYGTYSIDQHFPTPKNSFFFPGNEFKSTMKHYFNEMGVGRALLRDDQVPPPYFLPYRCLYSVNVNNMFMAGRNVSVSHIALSSTRVQNMTGMMGEVVGEAAAICKKHECSPRGVYTDHLEELLNAFK